MPLPKLIKENFVLFLGIALPLVLVIFLMLATVLPRRFVEPPHYDLLFTASSYRNDPLSVLLRYDVKEGHIRARVVHKQKNHYYSFRKLYLFSSKTQEVREITVEVPDDLENLKDGQVINILDTDGWKIDTSFRAPDGYEFKHNSGRYSKGFLFIGGGYKSHSTISNNGASYKIQPVAINSYYNDIHFLGWVTSRDSVNQGG